MSPHSKKLPKSNSLRVKNSVEVGSTEINANWGRTKICCESTYQNLSSFQNLYQLLSYLKIWACWTWFALNFLEMLSEHEIGTFSTFLMVKIWQILHLALFRPEAVVVACFTTSRARKAIDQATQNYFYFWPRSNRLASRGHRIQCT